MLSLTADTRGAEKHAVIFVDPEFSTVSRPDLVAADREADDANFDLLITSSFNVDALKNTGKDNQFVVIGEPNIDTDDGQMRVKINGEDALVIP